MRRSQGDVRIFRPWRALVHDQEIDWEQTAQGAAPKRSRTECRHLPGFIRPLGIARLHADKVRHHLERIGRDASW